ncbi:mechanosensitive ion channel family protein [Halalkalicoccus sp. NIPERK01]|uniref:mechanosensitive ion channel family protein n=1 Tax=Halalkalicoccus sp. NIPERK01 TaxID=3053469 RepID=UPI00256F6361|nr:mechanosensitive ion channel family protein [Halalkalicoccus sp. NIPERK01]MDL5360374.1 mechanosensitive ion channel family protein [Halalkalicoccus sp. NIPERK01]
MVLEGFLVDLGLRPGPAAAIDGAIRFLVAFIALVIVGRAVVLPLLDRAFDSRDLEPHAQRPLKKVAWFGVLFGAVAIAFGFGGYGSFLTSLATIAAAAALAIGIAMQSVISNFVAGVFIFTEKPFRIGDWIEWQEGDYLGIVEDISLRVTRVRTFDNELITVPNSDLTDNAVKNPVAKDTLRQKFVFGIGYDDDIETASEVIVEEAENHEEILDDPAPTVRLTELGDSDVGLQSRFWIADPARSDFVRIRGEYVQRVKERFDREGIDIPYPYRTLEGGLSVESLESVRPRGELAE